MIEQWKHRENRAHFGTAMLTALVANLFRDKSSKPSSPFDFLPFPEPQKYMSVEESQIALERLTLVFDGKDLRDGK